MYSIIPQTFMSQRILLLETRIKKIDKGGISLDNTHTHSALAKQLRTMSFDKFFDLLMMVYITILHILQRVSVTHTIITQIIQDAKARGLIVGMESLQDTQAEPSSPSRSVSPSKKSPHGRQRRKTFEDDDDLDVGALDTLSLETNQWAATKAKSTSASDVTEGTVFDTLVAESANVLASACDLAHVRCAKLIGVRSDQNAMLNPHDFYRFFGATWEFVNGAEAITGRICFGLKGTLVSQVYFQY